MSSLTRVYRYENPKNHRGPYNDHNGDWWNGPLEEMLLEHDDDQHLAWQRDGMMLASMDGYPTSPSRYISACATREALDSWFDGWNDRLTELGYKVVAYDVPEEAVINSTSGKQCAFLANEGKIVE